MHRMTRREFTQGSLTAAGLVTAGFSATARGYYANESLRVGCIGTGGRCRRLMQDLARIDGVKITAVCDVWAVHLAEGKKLADAKATETTACRALLDRSET